MKFSSIILVSILMASCSGTPQSGNETNAEASDLTYHYEPEISQLSGTLSAEVFWGPPNYGEDTLVDEKEVEYVLKLDRAIHIAKPDSDVSDGYNAAIANVKKLQIVHMQTLDAYLNKHVTASGTLFGAQTGHHHTQVLLDLKSIKE